jgi:replicative DNA helicase
MSLRQRIKDGLDGKFEGLNNGFTRINNYIFGVQKKCFTLIGGDSGTYKTTILDYIISNAIEDALAQGKKIDVFYYSFEIDKLTKQCNWLSRAVYNKYGKIIPPQKIKGLGKDNKLTEDEQELVDSCIPEVEEMFSKIKFVFDPLNPTGIRNELFKHFESIGKILYQEYKDEHGVDKKRIVGYVPDDPDRVTICAIDHLALMKEERGFDTKSNIDKMSEYTIFLRNTFDLTAFYLQQFNDGLSSVERVKFKGVDLSPQKSDFKDSRNPYQDADVVIGLMSPFKLDMTTCLGYNVSKLKKKMIMFKIIKNRLADDGIAAGLYCKPESGSFMELPDPESVLMENYYTHKI